MNVHPLVAGAVTTVPEMSWHGTMIFSAGTESGKLTAQRSSPAQGAVACTRTRTSSGWVGVGTGAVTEMRSVLWREAWRRDFMVWGRVAAAILVVAVMEKARLAVWVAVVVVRGLERRGRFALRRLVQSGRDAMV